MTRRGRPREEIASAVVASVALYPMATFQLASTLQVPTQRVESTVKRLKSSGVIVQVGSVPRRGRRPVAVYGPAPERPAVADVFRIVWI